MPVTVEYRCKCEKCGQIWHSSEYSEICSKCKSEKKNEENKENSTYKGYKDKYTGYYGQNWEKQRQKALERDNFECKVCGVTQKEHKQNDEYFGKGLQIHHIIPSKSFDSYEKANTIGNLVTLCSKCHKKAPY